ncbi:HNH endonuclease [Paludibaculum fermentans]|uniref:HNH endonuclease n=1 Tax=Paludibaculum fermentans TaxID=1473598 RepID=UPI003EB70CAB
MASIQHQDARRLLDIIQSTAKNSKLLTYGEAARLMGRPEHHSRAIAQMCDLLDAAACLAGVPLLALVAVRSKSGEINPKAWEKEYGPMRDAIIKRSQDHQFIPEDFTAIAEALLELEGGGNRKAWKYVKGLYSEDELYQRLTKGNVDVNANAVEDLGVDMPNHTRLETWTYARDPRVRAAVLRRAGGKCEFCGKLGFMKADGSQYLETHHIIALAKDGADRTTNVIALCADDHREAHFGARSEEIERQMMGLLGASDRRFAHCGRMARDYEASTARTDGVHRPT